MATKKPVKLPAKKKYSAVDDVTDFARSFLIPFDDIRYLMKGRKKNAKKP